LEDRVYAEILPDADFWPASSRHQKFQLQRGHRELVEELAGGSSGLDAFLASTAAARLNAYVTGFAGEEALAEAAEELGWDVDVLRLRLEEPKRESD
jgi:hypothetical protein